MDPLLHSAPQATVAVLRWPPSGCGAKFKNEKTVLVYVSFCFFLPVASAVACQITLYTMDDENPGRPRTYQEVLLHVLVAQKRSTVADQLRGPKSVQKKPSQTGRITTKTEVWFIPPERQLYTMLMPPHNSSAHTRGSVC